MSLKSTKEEHVAGPGRQGQGVDSRAPREHSADRPWRLLRGAGVKRPPTGEQLMSKLRYALLFWLAKKGWERRAQIQRQLRRR